MVKIIFLVSLLTLGLIFNGAGILSFSVQNGYSYTLPILPTQNSAKNSSKLIVLAFDDSNKSQFTLAKPILDKYDFKGSFFTVCNYVNNGTQGKDKTRMTWQDIKT
jgi:peptidoglycan/xylan/chitin deacetylase (PgdA/CDA1 family)